MVTTALIYHFSFLKKWVAKPAKKSQVFSKDKKSFSWSKKEHTKLKPAENINRPEIVNKGNHASMDL